MDHDSYIEGLVLGFHKPYAIQNILNKSSKNKVVLEVLLNDKDSEHVLKLISSKVIKLKF